MMKTNIPEDMTIEVKSHEKQQQRFLKLECTGRHDFTYKLTDSSFGDCHI